MTNNLKYEEITEFQKDFKRLIRKYPSLPDDFKLAKKAAIELFHLFKINNFSVFPIPHFCSEDIQVCKVRKFACKSLKGRGIKSGIRIIYAYHKNPHKAVFLEIYFKGDKVNEDKDRIKAYLKGHPGA